MKEQLMGNVFEGESYVGKSTTAETIKNLENIIERGIVIVPEYSVVGKLPSFPRESIGDLKKSIQTIIDLEKKRTDILTKGLSLDPNADVIFDRGPISCIAFENAAQKNGYFGAALWMAEAFQRAIEDGGIIIPKGVIHFTANRGVIAEREYGSLVSGHKRIIDFLRDENVIKSLNEAFAAFGEFLPNQLFITLDSGGKKSEEIGLEVLQFIHNQPKDVEEKVPDFIEYAQKLIDM